MRLKVVLNEIILFNTVLCLRVTSLQSVNNLSRAHCGLSHFKGPAERIVGGRIARNGEFPWTVSVLDNGEFKCGGSILDSFHVLTAAHCLYRTQPSEITIRYNSLLHSKDSHQRSASKLIIHPKYDIKTVDNDIAIILLKRGLLLNRLNSGTVCLPSKRQPLTEGQMVSVSGWGLTNRFKSSDVLRTTDLPVVPMNVCLSQYRSLPELYTITDNMICAGLTSGGQDSCSGDSGGPLVTNFNGKQFVLIGIVSKGFGCALPNKAGVYTRVSNYVEWIEKIIKNFRPYFESNKH